MNTVIFNLNKTELPWSGYCWYYEFAISPGLLYQSIVILIIRNIVSYAELLVVLILMSQVLYVFGTEKIMKVN